ncbi:MAG TPA: NifU family protein [Solirubrobacterales bacterium]|jgi:Fe-S cluster biogenesis protein NfuA/nitrite reductase/ring-hydroxylating ferredoxin subunit|nr:NifU family protein [Solirubrobacterales bacterium]
MDASIAAAPPAAAAGDSSSEELLERVQRLSERVERLEDRQARDAAQELVAAILEMHGAGLARIGAVLDEAGAAGEAAKAKLVADPVVASLLLIHDLYPVPLEQRVGEALEEVRPYMESHDGNVELLGVEDGVVRLRLAGSCDGCPASASTLELAIKEALEKAAPDLAGLEVEGVVAEQAPPSGTPLPVIQKGNGNGNGNGAAPTNASLWMPLGAAKPHAGEISRVEVGGTAIALANVGESLLAFRDRCAACGGPIAGGTLEGGVLDCPSCERRFYLPRAGRSMDEERLLLEPVPLLESGGAVTVAVGG